MCNSLSWHIWQTFKQHLWIESSSSRSRSKNWKQAVTADKGRKGRAGVPVVTTTTNDRYYVNVKGGGKGRGSQAAANSGSENR